MSAEPELSEKRMRVLTVIYGIGMAVLGWGFVALVVVWIWQDHHHQVPSAAPPVPQVASNTACSRALGTADAAVSKTNQAMKALADGMEPDLKALSRAVDRMISIQDTCSAEAMRQPSEQPCNRAAQEEAAFISYALKVVEARVDPGLPPAVADDEARAWLSIATMHEQKAVAERSSCPFG